MIWEHPMWLNEANNGDKVGNFWPINMEVSFYKLSTKNRREIATHRSTKNLRKKAKENWDNLMIVKECVDALVSRKARLHCDKIARFRIR